MSLLRGLFTVGLYTSRQPQFIQQSRNIKRWVAPTLREIRKRKILTRPEKLTPRSSFTDWNPNAELYAFGARLAEQFELPILQRAFIHPSYIAQELDKQREVGIENPTLEVEDNKTLIETGDRLITSFVGSYVDKQLASAPIALRTSIKDYLISNEMLAKISRNLGTTDLILSSEFPVQENTLADTFKAVVAALAESSEERATLFIRDFVCTHLNQLDYTNLWKPENALKELESVCAAEKLGAPEPRLIGSCGTATLLAAYNVGIYSNKKMIGSGFGETVDIAVQEASYDALRGLYQIRDHQQQPSL